MKRALFLLPFLLLCGCSRSQQASVSPQNPPEIPTGAFETSASISAEMDRRFPPPQKPKYVSMTNVLFEILDGARTERVSWAVKDWCANMNSMTLAVDTPNNPQTKAFLNCIKWVAAAYEAKKNNLLSASNSEYETAKKNALSEAARADSLG